MKLLQLFVTISVSSLLLTSCDFESSTPDEPPVITYHDSTIVERNEGCDPTDDESVCCVVELEIPVFEGGNEDVVGKLNRRTRGYFVSLLGSNTDDDVATIPSIKDAASMLMDEFTEFQSEFPMSSVGWEVRGGASVLTLDSLLCLRFDSYSYLGGAHGIYAEEFDVIDVNTGDSVNVLELISDKESFMSQAEAAFRDVANIAPDQDDYAAEGYWFEDNKYSLPENIGVTADSIVLYYNVYEIAPYSMGPTRVALPRTLLK